MKEIFYEESSAPTNSGREEKIHNILRVVAIVFFVVGVIVLLTGLPSGFGYFFGDKSDKELLYSFISAVLFAVVFVACGLLFFSLKNRFNVVYDYSFVSGDIRIVKVNGTKRKFVYEIKPQEISKIGKTSDRAFDGYVRQGVRQLRFSKNKVAANGKDFYYFYCSSSSGKTVVVLECREDMIKNMSYYVGKDVLEQL